MCRSSWWRQGHCPCICAYSSLNPAQQLPQDKGRCAQNCTVIGDRVTTSTLASQPREPRGPTYVLQSLRSGVRAIEVIIRPAVHSSSIGPLPVRKLLLGAAQYAWLQDIYLPEQVVWARQAGCATQQHHTRCSTGGSHSSLCGHHHRIQSMHMSRWQGMN